MFGATNVLVVEIDEFRSYRRPTKRLYQLVSQQHFCLVDVMWLSWPCQWAF